ncbi:MAG: hypothetical protein M1114_03910 [Candidatus Dependentiae bacterium]|nr:hypothetical protein [Candidatus Dependentiae bacterium]
MFLCAILLSGVLNGMGPDINNNNVQESHTYQSYVRLYNQTHHNYIDHEQYLAELSKLLDEKAALETNKALAKSLYAHLLLLSRWVDETRGALSDFRRVKPFSDWRLCSQKKGNHYDILAVNFDRKLFRLNLSENECAHEEVDAEPQSRLTGDPLKWVGDNCAVQDTYFFGCKLLKLTEKDIQLYQNGKLVTQRIKIAEISKLTTNDN